jgi:putative DNA primase/helicase
MTDAVTQFENDLHNDGKKARNGKAQCPAHDDSSPSLTYSAGTKWPLILKCMAGCSPDDVLAALGRTWTDYGETKKRDEGFGDVTDRYIYEGIDGIPRFRVNRTTTKKFWQEHNAGGTWVKGLGGNAPILYRLPQVARAVLAGETVYIAEGEKDVHALESLGVTATCNPMGATKWKQLHTDTLDGAAHVVIVADRDEIGYEHARIVRDALIERVQRLDIVRAAVGKDAADHIAAGRGLDQLEPFDPDNPIDWAEPTPLRTVSDPDPFPVDCLPAWVQDHVTSIAAELQAPVDLPAMLALAALSTACNGSAKVHVRGTWKEGVNLYLVVAMPPGAGKSPAFRHLFDPLDEWNTEAATAAAESIAKAEQRLRMIEDELRKAEKAGDAIEAEVALDKKLALVVPVAPRLFVDDVTPEALVPILADQGGRLALVSSEGGPFEMMVGRYSERANLEPYLQAWSGDTIRVDRVGRGSLTVPDARLVIGLTVQPQVIAALADKPELAGRGLTARFMYSIPPNLVGQRDLITNPEADEDAYDNYAKRIKDLATERRSVGAPETLTMTPEARLAFLQWRQDLEHRRSPDGELAGLEEWTTKLESSVVRVAGLLHLADEPPHRPIPLGTMERAIAIGSYWLSHAWRVHALWSPQGVVDRAERILRWMRRGQVERFSARELHRSGVLERVRGGSIEAYVEPLQLLVDNGYLRPDEEGPVVLGVRGKPSPTFTCNPFAIKVVRHVRHVTRDISEFSLTHSLQARTSEPPDMPDMPDNPRTCAPIEPTAPTVDNPAPSPIPTLDF